MKPHSLVFRLALLQQVLAAVLIAVFAGSAVWLSARTLERQELRFLSATARKMADNLDRDLEKHDDLKLVALEIVGEDAPVGVRVDVLDEQGRLVATTAPGRSARREETWTRQAHLSHGGWVVVSTSTRPRRNAISALILALLLTAAPLLIAVAAISRALARRALRPLSRMAVQAEQATLQGDLRALGHPSDPVEVATLSTAFNRLLARVDKMLKTEREFTQDAAHELRTPLTVLSGELERASSDATLPEARREGLVRAWDQARGISGLVEALLLLRGSDASATEAFVPVNLTDLLQDLGHELGERLPDRAHDLEIVGADEVLVWGQAPLLSSALRNLLSNAFKFSQAGQAVRATSRVENGNAVVVVDDGGPGIAPADLDRIFDPFFRSAEARANQEGFGLGLPILRRVARAHGGDVTVSKSDLGGARFELRLPVWTSRRRGS
jgi:two-component system, OmpR family, heavy metal sensor histidine kinase CusS